MNRWHPATKLLLLAALPAIPYLLWTASDDPAAPAAVVAQAGRAGEAAAAEPAAGDGSEATETGGGVQRRTLPPLQTFAALVERPLFTPTRRLVRPVEAPPPEEPEPDQPVVEAEEAPPVEPEETAAGRPELRFFGTVKQGRRYTALVTREGETNVEQLGLGDEVDDWKVSAIARERLVLTRGGEEAVFEIFKGGER